MYLINTQTVRLKKISTQQRVRYVILSHRWTKKEVDFADINSKDFQLRLSSNKLQGAVKQARQDGYKYLWVDSCCIDQRSSAELSEAINSMYRWYQAADICYVYLQDLDVDDWQESLGKSKWFTRGWTLQELLAPRKAVFYDSRWRLVGNKDILAEKLSSITGVPGKALRTGDLNPYSVAQKMAWAAKRMTTRPEDMAYCLMGLFDVNIPLLYGKGGYRAFVRLQEEIIRHSDDHSIFAWSMGKRRASGLLAPAPSCFAGSQDMVPQLLVGPREPFSMTNRGLSIKLKITPWLTDTYVAFLDCAGESWVGSGKGKKTTRVGVFLRRLHEDDQYVRMRICRKGLWFDTEGIQYREDRPVKDRQLFVRQNGYLSCDKDCLKDIVYGFKISPTRFPSSSYLERHRISANYRFVTLAPGGWGCVAIIHISAQHQGLRKIALGFDFEFNPVCLLEDSFSRRDSNADVELQNWFDWSHVLADRADWDEIVEGDGVIRRPIETHKGLWKLKGHRQRGLDVHLSKSFTDWGSLVKLKRNTGQPKLFWEFDIDNIIDPFRNLEHQALVSSFGSRENFQHSYGLSLDMECLGEGDEILGQLSPILVSDMA